MVILCIVQCVVWVARWRAGESEYIGIYRKIYMKREVDRHIGSVEWDEREWWRDRDREI